MELMYLKTFCEVAARHSFTKAAEELGYAQSSITTQIQKLEKEYGVILFERYGRRLRLTQPGEMLLKIAQKMLNLYTESKEIIANQVSGTLTIGTMAIKRYVRNGLGIALLPGIVVEEEVQQGTLTILPFVHPELRFELQYYIHPKKWMSQPLLKLIQLISDIA